MRNQGIKVLCSISESAPLKSPRGNKPSDLELSFQLPNRRRWNWYGTLGAYLVFTVCSRCDWSPPNSGSLRGVLFWLLLQYRILHHVVDKLSWEYAHHPHALLWLWAVASSPTSAIMIKRLETARSAKTYVEFWTTFRFKVFLPICPRLLKWAWYGAPFDLSSPSYFQVSFRDNLIN